MILSDYWDKIQHIADNTRWYEQSQAKYDIITKLFLSLDINISNIILPSFNPVVLLLEKNFNCTVVGDQSTKYAWQSNSQFVDNLQDISKPADIVLALDEFFTYAETEQDQRDILNSIKKITNGYLVTTLQDYKNNAPHKRSQVDASMGHGSNNLVVVEQNIADKNNRQNWLNYIYMIENHKDLTVLGPVVRRTMYFKQLAKYSSDIGGTDYVIQKNLLYRGFFKKNYEHIITVRF